MVSFIEKKKKGTLGEEEIWEGKIKNSSLDVLRGHVNTLNGDLDKLSSSCV